MIAAESSGRHRSPSVSTQQNSGICGMSTATPPATGAASQRDRPPGHPAHHAGTRASAQAWQCQDGAGRSLAGVPVTFDPVDPDDRDPADPATLAAVERAFGGPLPADYRAFLHEVGGFYGDLWLPGGVVFETRLFGAAEVLSELDYAVFADERCAGTIPIGGMSAWRYCLQRSPGPDVRYLDIDLGSGDLLHEFTARSFESFLVELVEQAGAPRPGAHP
jgi:hypothetical protein